MKNASGFTLLEVIISMIILSFLSLMTMQAIRHAVHTKVKVQTDIDRTSALHDALAIMTRDINLAFNYRDVSIQLYNDMQDARKQLATKPPPSNGKGSPPPTPPPPPPTPAPGQPDPYAHKPLKIDTAFIGTPNSLDFTSLSNVRMLENSPISSQAEIGYRLKPCRSRSNDQHVSQCLWRRISNYIHDDDITKYGEETVLLEDVTELKFRYLGPGHQDEWLDTWKSNDAQDDTTRNKFPYAVEITIAIRNKDKKEHVLKETTVASVHNPNNPPQDNTPNAQKSL